MTPRQLEIKGAARFGFGWRGKLQVALGVDRKTLYRWTHGITPIPRYVIEALKSLD